jgi:amidase
MGTNWRGLYTTTLLEWRQRADELSKTLKVSMLIGHYFIKHNGGRFTPKHRTSAASCVPPMMPLSASTISYSRSPIDADSTAQGDAAGERAARALHSTSFRDARKHGALRRDRPPGDEHSLRHERGSAGRSHADRKPLRRVTIYRAAAAFEKAGDWTKM